MRFNKKYLFASFVFTIAALDAAEAKKTAASAGATSSVAKATTKVETPPKVTVANKQVSNSSSSAPAATAAAPLPTVEGSKAVDFSAKDVWSKDLFERDDNKVLVIQDRKYNKSGRLELGLDLGSTAATAFYNTYTGGARLAYYFNEYWGLQWFGNYSISTASREKEQLDNYFKASGFASTKEYKQPRLFTGLGVLWNPIYGKFAWFRSSIIHFDIYAGLGLSYLTTESSLNFTDGIRTYKGYDDAAIGTLANLGLRVFLNKHLAWTTEIRNNIYQAKYADSKAGKGDPTSPEIPSKKVMQNNFQFVTGISYMFNIAGY
jgi:outer membrane beta-barrel protein